MSLFDLLFLAVALTTIVSVFVILGQLLLGRRKAALRLLIRLGAGLAAYLLIAAVVALFSPQHILRMGEDRCFDDLCFAATRVKAVPSLGPEGAEIRPRGKFCLVTVRASSRARRRPQRELGIDVSLIDSHGRVYGSSPAGQQAFQAEYGPNPPLTSLLHPGETIYSVIVFDVPVDAAGLALHIGHTGPGFLIIGDDESPLHKPTIVPLGNP